MIVRILVAITAMTVLAATAETAVSSDKKLQESFWQIYTSAQRGDNVAQYQAGVIFERGMGVERNQEKAAEWYEKSAWQGNVDAQYNLALMYISGRGVAQNEERAMIWLAKAARQGDKEARKLLLAIIDGKLERDKKSETVGEKAEPIKPVRLITKEGAQVCMRQGECSVYRTNTTLTSKSKRGKYYIISGIGTKQGWEPFEGEGWIDEESVEIRH